MINYAQLFRRLYILVFTAFSHGNKVWFKPWLLTHRLYCWCSKEASSLTLFIFCASHSAKYFFHPKTTMSADVCIWAAVNQSLDRCHCSDECLHRKARHEGFYSSVCGCHGNTDRDVCVHVRKRERGRERPPPFNYSLTIWYICQSSFVAYTNPWMHFDAAQRGLINHHMQVCTCSIKEKKKLNNFCKQF